MIFVRSSKFTLFYCFGVLLLARKSSTINEVDKVGVLKVNEFAVVPNINDKSNELSKHMDGSKDVSRSWGIELDSKLNINYKFHKNIGFCYEYYNKVVQVMLLMFFGFLCDRRKIQTILRFPVGCVISMCCRWIYAPLVSSFRYIFASINE